MTTFHLYFDDSGSRRPDEEPEARQDGIDGFALGGVLIDESDIPQAYDMHAAFMEAWALRGPLHSTKIRGSRGHFRWLRGSPRRDEFLNDLERLLFDIPAVGIACVIHRPGYNLRYKDLHGDQRWLMCKTATAILVERAAKYASERDSKLCIHFEECGKKEDRDLIAHVKDLKQNGMPFDNGNSAVYGGLSGEDFRRVILGDPNRITKKSGIMQIADLYLFPMIEGGYDRGYRPYAALGEAGKLIDCTLSPEMIASRGIKYSCFT